MGEENLTVFPTSEAVSELNKDEDEKRGKEKKIAEFFR